MRLLVKYISVVLILLSSCVHAKHNQSDKFISGMSYQLNGQNLSVFINQKTVMHSMRALQKAGYLDRNLTQTEASFYPSLLPASLSMRYTIDILKNIYVKNANADVIHINAYLLSFDLYGNNEKAICYSFDFNRELYKKINWKNFQISNLKRVAPNFKSYGVCQSLTEINPTAM